MLLGEYFGGRHDRHLIAVLNGHYGGLTRDNRLAATHITLQQPAHRTRGAHILYDFAQRCLLGRRWMKREDGLEFLAQIRIRTKADSRLGFRRRPLPCQAGLEKEKFLEDQSKMSGAAEG